MTLSGLIREILPFLVLSCDVVGSRGRAGRGVGVVTIRWDPAAPFRTTVSSAESGPIRSYSLAPGRPSRAYTQVRRLAGFMGREITQCFQDETSQAAIARHRVVIVPTPTTTPRVRVRG